jgi:hypothetical protein
MTDELRKLADDLCDLDGTWTTSASSLLGGYSSVICDQIVVAHCFREEVSAYIAAASPASVIALLDERDQWRQAAELNMQDYQKMYRERDEARDAATRQCERREVVAAQRDEAVAAVKRLAGALEDIHVERTDWPLKRDALADPVVKRIVEE